MFQRRDMIDLDNKKTIFFVISDIRGSSACPELKDFSLSWRKEVPQAVPDVGGLDRER